jgi:serine/threonine-protein kinase
MSVVYLARNERLGQRVALKLLRRESSLRSDGVERLLREARAVARIDNEHVARVLDAGTLGDGEPYVVFEYLQGSDLASILRDRGRLSISDSVDYTLQACEAMAAAHVLGIVHRDLKPSNLLLMRGRDGSAFIKVLDFGIAKALKSEETRSQEVSAKLTASHVVLGSPAYMAPEQVRSASAVDARADVWSLGVILYELLTGKLPFAAESSAGLLAAIAADAPIPLRTWRPDAPAGLESAISRCLQKERERRPENVVAFARMIARYGSKSAEESVARTARLLGVALAVRSMPKRSLALVVALSAIALGAAVTSSRGRADKLARTESAELQAPGRIPSIDPPHLSAIAVTATARELTPPPGTATPADGPSSAPAPSGHHRSRPLPARNPRLAVDEVASATEDRK